MSQNNPIRAAGQTSLAESAFPAVIHNEESLTSGAEVTAWIKARRTELAGTLADAGAILFRGFPLHTAEEFDAFVAAFGSPNFPYDESLSNAVRVNRTPRVFTANEAPAEITIFLHHEMAQTPLFPGKIFFFCEKPAETGGSTPLCRSDRLWERLALRCPAFARDCEAKGLRYSHTMPGESDLSSGMGRRWRATLRVEGRAQAEQRLATLGYTWDWHPDGSLSVRPPGCRLFGTWATDGNRSLIRSSQPTAAGRTRATIRRSPSPLATALRWTARPS